jgi:CHAD domain-containing protein
MRGRAARRTLPLAVSGEDVAAAVAAAGWKATTDRPVTLTRTFLETFDGRLADEGTFLELEHSASGRRLRWRDQKGGTVRDELQLTDGETPRFAWDLPGGPLRDGLGPILEVRAMLPAATVRTRRAVVETRDDEEKLVARVVVDRDVVIEADGASCRRDVGSTIEVLPLRGYEDDAAALARGLTDRLALESPPADRVAVIFGLLRHPPGTYSSKLRVQLDSDMPAIDAATGILRTLLAVIEANHDGTLADVDSEFLHDLRVAVRRTRSGLKAFPGVFAPGPLERFAPGFRWVQQVSGDARDLDVFVLGFDDELTHLPAEAAADLEPLRGLLVDKRAAAHRRLERSLRSVRYRRLLERWHAFLDDGRRGPEADRPVVEVASDRIWSAYRRVVKRGRRIDADSPAEDLHTLRKRGKELRYLLEFFGSLYPKSDAGGLVRELKDLQDYLGDFQDDQVQAATLHDFGGELAAAGAGPDTLVALGQLVAHHRRTSDEARHDFADRFGDFDSKANRRRFEHLFHA